MMQRRIVIFALTLLPLLVAAGIVNVPAGQSGRIKSAATAAAAGDTLLLSTGDYTETSNIVLAKALTVMAAQGAQPVLKMSCRFEVSSDFALLGVQIHSSAEIVRMVYADTPYSVAVRNCELSGCPAKFIRAYSFTGVTEPYINKLTVDNCIFRMERPATDNKPCAIEASHTLVQLKSLEVKNSTFDGGVNGTGRMIYLHADSVAALEGTVEIDHCTFYNTTDTRGVYLANINGCHVSNCIFMNPEAVPSGAGFALYGADSRIDNSLSWYAPVKISTGAISSHCINRNPYFVDAANGNFQLAANSSAVGMATDGGNVGDPRWGVSTEEHDINNDPYEPYKMPYSMAPTTHSVKILWQMSEEVEPTEALVYYGTDSTNLDHQITTSDGWPVPEEGYVHVVTLTDLQPFTRYYFTVGANATRRCEKISWTKTAPEAGTAYRIFSISDIHGNSCNNWSNMQDYICSLNCDIALMNGDFVSSKGDDRNWNNYYFTPGAKFLGQVPVMSSVGNHETGDPFTYRWASYYDYFHQFSHEGEPEDSIKDPRGEAYFHFTYGNADVVMLNINGDPSSPDFLPGSKQYKWADSIFAACTQPWIIVCHHVGMWTSGYHGQWSDEPKKFSKLLEKHAALGKRIISLSGDDHSFEHLYKDGVHYVRPGCGRNSNYAQQTQLKDAKYSLFYRQVSCYSIFDMSADASYIDLSARDSVGTEFYTYRFMLDGSDRPLSLSTPEANETARKILMAGVLYIRKPDGELYTMVGTPVRRKE